MPGIKSHIHPFIIFNLIYNEALQELKYIAIRNKTYPYLHILPYSNVLL